MLHRWVRTMEEHDSEWQALPIPERESIISNLRDRMGLGKEIGKREAEGFKQFGEKAIEKVADTQHAIVEHLKHKQFEEVQGQDIESTDLINKVIEWETGGWTPPKQETDKTKGYWNELVRPFLAEAAVAAEGLNLGLASMSRNIDEMMAYLSSKRGKISELTEIYPGATEFAGKVTQELGLYPGGAFDQAFNTYMQNAEFWHHQSEKYDPNFMEQMVGEAVGGALPGIAEFMMGVPYAAVSGAKDAAMAGDNEVLGALQGGAKRWFLGRIFKGLGQLRKEYAAPSMGAVFGLDAIASGASPEEVAKSVGTGLLYGVAGKGGKYGIRDVIEMQKSWPKEAPRWHTGKDTTSGTKNNNILMDKKHNVYESSKSLPEMVDEFGLDPKNVKDHGLVGDQAWPQWTFRKPSIVELQPAIAPEPKRPSEKTQKQMQMAVDATKWKTPPDVTKQDMLKEIEKATGIRIGFKKYRQKALGIYYPSIQAIRQKMKLDVPTTVHELCHHMERYMNLRALFHEATKSRELMRVEEELRKTAYPGAKDEIGEGIAEHYRLYVTHPEIAAKRCPTWNQLFEEALREYPEIQDLTVNLRTMWKEWSMLDEVQQASSFIAEHPLGKKSAWNLDEIYRIAIDEIYPLKQLGEVVRKAGGKPSIVQDPYYMAWLARGWARKAENWIKWGTFEYDLENGIKSTGPSLREILKDVNKSGELPILDTYLFARRTYNNPKLLKKWSQGAEPVFAPEKFLKAIQMIEKEYPHLVKVADECTGYANRLLKYLKDSGRISSDLYNTILDNSMYYAPLYEAMDADVPSLQGLSKRKFANLFQPVKRIFEAQHMTYSPTQSLIYNTYTFINVAERQRVANALARMTQMPGAGRLIQKIPPPVKPTQVFKEAHAGYLAYLKEMGKMLDFDKEFLAGLKTKLWRPDYTPKSNEILIFRGGEPVLYEIKDPHLRNAVLAVDGEMISPLVNYVSYPAKWLRAGATRFSPEFVFRNPVRDQWTAWIYSKYKPWWNPATVPYDLGRGLFHILGKTEMYERFNASGGAHAALVSIDRNYLEKDLHKIMRTKSEAVKSLINPKNWLSAIQAFSELSEEATRVGEFARAYTTEKAAGKSGMEAMHKAGLAARDITLDFQRLGAKMKAMNMITAFFNAQLQGMDKMRRELQSGNAGTVMGKIFMGVTLPSILLWWAQKDDPYYQELPSWRKVLFWNIVTHKSEHELKQEWEQQVQKGVTNKIFESWRLEPGRDLEHVWSIPKPFEPGLVFGSAVEGILDWMVMNDPDSMNDAIKGIIEGAAPGAIPTAFLAPLEWMSNYNRFFERPLVPRRKEELEPWAQYTNYTSDTLRVICKGLKDVPYLKNLASPAKLQNTIQTWTGGGGRLLLNAADALVTRVGLLDKEPEGWGEFWSPDTPVVRAFIGRMPGASIKSIERFYKDYERERMKWQTYKVEKMRKPPGAVVAEPPKLRRMRNIALTMNLLREELNIVERSTELDPKVRDATIEVLSWNMVNLARMGLGKTPLLPRSLSGQWGLQEAVEHAKGLVK